MAYKCKYCKRIIKTENCFSYVLNNKKSYFCNEEHYNLFVEKKYDEQKDTEEKRIEIKNKQDCYLIICEIFDRKDIINTLLWKEWKEWNKIVSSEIIQQFLEENKTSLHDYISKLNSSECSKIIYFSAILKNRLWDYKAKTKNMQDSVISESHMQNTKIINGLFAKYSNLTEFTNAYIDMYINPLNMWDDTISLQDRANFIFVANILNEDDIAKHIAQMRYGDFLLTPYWKAISDYVKEKSNNVCKLCGNKHNLNTHHKVYDNHGYEHRIINIENDLIVLCRDCHKKIHGKTQ